MAERVLRRPALSFPRQNLLDSPLSRRQFTREGLKQGAAVVAALALDGTALAATLNREKLEELRQKALPNNEFTQYAHALSQEEIKSDIHHEETIEFRSFELGGKYFFEGTFEGPGTLVLLEFPGVYRQHSRLSVFDICIDDDRVIRTGIISSSNPTPKRVILGPLAEPTREAAVHHIKIFYVTTREKTIITPDELVPRLSYATTPYSLRSLVNDTVAFTVPRSGESVWNDCIVKKITIPYRQDGNYRFLGWKQTTAEDSRYESLYDDWGRTYDEDWETKIEVTPDRKILQVYVQKRGHLTKNYNSNYFMFGTHPVVEVYTENGMVRPAQNYFSSMPYFADEPTIVSAAEWQLLRKNHCIDTNLQEASFDELIREKKDPRILERLIVDFRKRSSPRKTPFRF